MSSQRHSVNKRTTQKEDGRVLIFYTFDCLEDCSGPVADEQHDKASNSDKEDQDTRKPQDV